MELRGRKEGRGLRAAAALGGRGPLAPRPRPALGGPCPGPAAPAALPARLPDQNLTQSPRGACGCFPGWNSSPATPSAPQEPHTGAGGHEVLCL